VWRRTAEGPHLPARPARTAPPPTPCQPLPLVYWDEEGGLWLEDGGEVDWDAALSRATLPTAPPTPPPHQVP